MFTTKLFSPLTHLITYHHQHHHQARLYQCASFLEVLLMHQAISQPITVCGESQTRCSRNLVVPCISSTRTLILISSERLTWCGNTWLHLHSLSSYDRLSRFMTQFMNCLREKLRKCQIGCFQWYSFPASNPLSIPCDELCFPHSDLQPMDVLFEIHCDRLSHGLFFCFR